MTRITSVLTFIVNISCFYIIHLHMWVNDDVIVKVIQIYNTYF